MAVYNYSVEGIYETDKGSGIDLTPFKFNIELSRFEGFEKGAGSHILRRFLPILIRGLKNKPFFSKIRSWVITNIEKVSDDFPLKDKEIAKMNEQELQELACLYDLFEVPLPSTVSLPELIEATQKAYLKKVIKIPMETPEEQMKCQFFVPQSDGSLKFDLKGACLKVEIFDKTQKRVEAEKKSLEYFLDNARKTNGSSNENGIISSVTNIDNGEENENTGFKVPSLDDLTKNVAGIFNGNKSAEGN